jgi:hypothetical protein
MYCFGFDYVTLSCSAVCTVPVQYTTVCGVIYIWHTITYSGSNCQHDVVVCIV